MGLAFRPKNRYFHTMSDPKLASDLIEAVLKNPETSECCEQKKKLAQLLSFDELNLLYFLSLYRSKKSGQKKDLIQIFDESQDSKNAQIAYPTAIAPPEMLTHLPYVEHKQLLEASENYSALAQTATLWIKKMQAGSGSSITRGTYLSRFPSARVGAKGTDLFIEVPNAPGQSVCLAEAQILQAIHDAKKGKFKSIVLHDLVNSETAGPISKIWSKPSLLDPSLSYQELIEKSDTPCRVTRLGPSVQAFIPTLNEAGQMSFEQVAPGGHALFALDALRAAYREDLLPKTQDSPLLSVIGNGEDLSSTPDPTMIGWMIQKKIPIAMVTTEKTPNDLKGGQIALVKKEDGSIYTTIIEQAQAKKANQQELFEKLGIEIKKNGQIAFFNTNMALFNYDELRPKIQKLVKKVGESAFLKAIAPDLISNVKDQHTQLEGAMGSSLLNLDRFWRSHYHEPLVHFINVDRHTRTRFFSPIKTAFDFFMQFHSDLFALDPNSMRLIHQCPGRIPSVMLKDPATEDKFYQDVQNVLESFQGTSLIGLNSLKIEGRFSLTHTILRGNVTLRNQTKDTIDLTHYFKENPGLIAQKDGKPVMDNVSIEVDSSGTIQLTQVEPST